MTSTFLRAGRVFAPALLLSALVSGCGDAGLEPEPRPSVAAVDVSAASTTLTSLGASTRASATVLGTDGRALAATVAWASSDDGVATVDAEGLVTSMADGTALVSATAGGVSGAVTITVAQAPAALAFTAQPADGIDGDPLAPVSIAVLDANGRTVAQADVDVTLSVEDPDAGATLAGATTEAAVGGIATFADVRVDGVVTAVRLLATADGLEATSDAFAVERFPAPFDDFQAAAFAIGQPDLQSGEANAGLGAVGPGGLNVPTAVAASKDILYVADFGNQRVLGFTPIPDGPGAEASFVLGQPSLKVVTPFDEIDPATATIAPITVVVDDDRLFVVDQLGNRVLIWNELPKETGVLPDVVIGQPDFVSITESATPSSLFRPFGLVVADGRLFVSDGANNRILIWNSVPDINGQAADLVLGQTSFFVGGRTTGPRT